ncbi:hypothetical protein ACFWEK_21550, partial [Isoptericola sp. NPDC060257]
ASARTYSFDRGRILDAPRDGRPPVRRIPVTDGQLEFERAHLAAKLRVRTPGLAPALDDAAPVRTHPLFAVVPGAREDWERG